MTDPSGTKTPRPGSITICIFCLEPGVFTPEMAVRKLDWNELPADLREKLKQALRSARAQRHEQAQKG